MGVRILPILFVFLTFGSVIASPVQAMGAIIEDRIKAAINFISSQYYSSSEVRGYLRGPDSTKRIFAEDNALVALGLAAFQETHSSTESYQALKLAIEFLQKAQASSADYYAYYDIPSQSWGQSGKLYYWNSYIILGTAYAAYVSADRFPTDRSYWTGVVNRLRLFLDLWVLSKQLPSGAVQFHFLGSSPREDLASNAALLAGIVNVALFEYFWGDRSLSRKYATWAESIANWLIALQEKRENSWGFGGFYSNSTRMVQLTYENGLAMFALNKYYSTIELLLSNFQPSISELREAMVRWAENFTQQILDAWNGPGYGRTENGIVSYPKETVSASAVLQAMADVWINIGGPRDVRFGPPYYWTVGSKIYEWLTGVNELSRNLQSAAGGFHEGIDRNGTIFGVYTSATSFTLFAMVRAGYVQIPELSASQITLLIVIFLASIAIARSAGQRRKRVDARPSDMTSSNCPAYI